VAAEPSDALVTGPGWASLTMVGEIDINSAPEYQPLVERMRDQRPRMIVVNLLRVSFMDSSGLGLIASLARSCREQGGNVYLVDASEMVKATVSACGLDQYVTLVDAEDPRLSESKNEFS